MLKIKFIEILEKRRNCGQKKDGIKKVAKNRVEELHKCRRFTGFNKYIDVWRHHQILKCGQMGNQV